MEKFDNNVRGRAEEVIGAYAESVGRPKPEQHVLNALDDRSLARLAIHCQDYLRYGREVDATITRTLPYSSAVMMRSDTPLVLQAVGCANLPMLHTQRHLRNELHPKDPNGEHREFHGLSLHQVKLFAEAVESPCAVLDNPAGKTGVVCVLDMIDADRLPIIMPFKPSGEGQYLAQEIQTNFILSIYGREGFENYLDMAAKTNRLLFFDHGKTERLLANSGLELPGSCRNLDGIIHRSNSTVKSPDCNARSPDALARDKRKPEHGPADAAARANEASATRNSQRGKTHTPNQGRRTKS